MQYIFTSNPVGSIRVLNPLLGKTVLQDGLPNDGAIPMGKEVDISPRRFVSLLPPTSVAEPMLPNVVPRPRVSNGVVSLPMWPRKPVVFEGGFDIDITKVMVSLSEILSQFRSLSWDERIQAMTPLRQGRLTLILSGNTYRVTKNGRFRLKREFRKQICEYNRQQGIGQPIRSIFSGEFVQPGSAVYTRTLRACRIERIHSTCREILSSDPFPHPRTGKIISHGSVLGRRLVKRCSS
jgi:hypothetical protein